MALFLQIPVLRGVLSGEQDRRQGVKTPRRDLHRRYEQYELFRLT